MDFYPGYASKTPIFKANESQKNEITKLVKDLMDLNKNLLFYNETIQKIYKKYSGVKKTKLREIIQNNFYRLLLKKDKKIKVREISIETDDDLILVNINGREFLKLQIKDVIKRKYLFFFIDSLEIDLLNIQEKNIFQAFKELEIDDFEDEKAINTVVEELDKFLSKDLLKNEITKLEIMLNDRIFKLYELSEEEIKYIKDSFY